MMPHALESLVFVFITITPAIALRNWNPDYSPAEPLDVTPLYDGLPPEGIDPLALGFYSTPEVREPVALEIEGEIPSWVTGSLYRGAQAGWDAGNFTSEHWFDGFSRQHRFEIENGTVSYRSRNESDEVQDCKLPLEWSGQSNVIQFRSAPRWLCV